MKRIFIFGDSILRGVYVAGERHRLFADRLSALRESGAEVENYSVMGATVSTGWKLLNKKLAPSGSLDSDAVVFEYGGNDCDFCWRAISENPAGNFEPNTPAGRFAAEYKACVDRAKSLGARVYLCSLVPLDTARYMDWIARGLKRSNLLRWLGRPERLRAEQEGYNRAVADIAAANRCTLIDLWTPFESRSRDFMSDDGIHPTPAGHRIIDGILTEALL